MIWREVWATTSGFGRAIWRFLTRPERFVKVDANNLWIKVVAADSLAIIRERFGSPSAEDKSYSKPAQLVEQFQHIFEQGRLVMPTCLPELLAV